MLALMLLFFVVWRLLRIAMLLAHFTLVACWPWV